MTRRLIAIAVASAGAVALSGCHQVLSVSLGGDDPPVHLPPPPARAVPAASAAGAPPGRAFRGSAEGRLASRITIRHGFVKSTIKNARFIGQFSGRLRGAAQPGDETLGLLKSAQWHAQFNTVRDRRNGKVRMSGLVLATFTDPAGGRACLKLAYRTPRKGKKGRAPKKGRSTLTVLGGEGGARTLRGSAAVNVTILGGDKLRVTGRIKPGNGPERGFNRACTRLEKKFKLTPLAAR